MQNLALDPKTGDYVIVNGRPVDDGTLNTPAYIRLKVKRGTWLYAPDPNFGSDYHLFHRRHLLANDVALLAVGQRALKPLVDDGRATAVQVTPKASARHAFESSALIVQANGKQSVLTFSPVTN